MGNVSHIGMPARSPALVLTRAYDPFAPRDPRGALYVSVEEPETAPEFSRCVLDSNSAQTECGVAHGGTPPTPATARRSAIAQARSKQ